MMPIYGSRSKQKDCDKAGAHTRDGKPSNTMSMLSFFVARDKARQGVCNKPRASRACNKDLSARAVGRGVSTHSHIVVLIIASRKVRHVICCKLPNLVGARLFNDSSRSFSTSFQARA